MADAVEANPQGPQAVGAELYGGAPFLGNTAAGFPPPASLEDLVGMDRVHTTVCAWLLPVLQNAMGCRLPSSYGLCHAPRVRPAEAGRLVNGGGSQQGGKKAARRKARKPTAADARLAGISGSGSLQLTTFPQVLVLDGPSGCGKSALVSLLAGRHGFEPRLLDLDDPGFLEELDSQLPRRPHELLHGRGSKAASSNAAAPPLQGAKRPRILILDCWEGLWSEPLRRGVVARLKAAAYNPRCRPVIVMADGSYQRSLRDFAATFAFTVTLQPLSQTHLVRVLREALLRTAGASSACLAGRALPRPVDAATLADIARAADGDCGRALASLRLVAWSEGSNTAGADACTREPAMHATVTAQEAERLLDDARTSGNRTSISVFEVMDRALAWGLRAARLDARDREDPARANSEVEREVLLRRACADPDMAMSLCTRHAAHNAVDIGAAAAALDAGAFADILWAEYTAHHSLPQALVVEQGTLVPARLAGVRTPDLPAAPHLGELTATTVERSITSMRQQRLGTLVDIGAQCMGGFAPWLRHHVLPDIEAGRLPQVAQLAADSDSAQEWLAVAAGVEAWSQAATEGGEPEAGNGGTLHQSARRGGSKGGLGQPLPHAREHLLLQPPLPAMLLPPCTKWGVQEMLDVSLLLRPTWLMQPLA